MVLSSAEEERPGMSDPSRTAFERYFGTDYSGAETPAASVK